jgi:hypothetical protein
MVTKLLKEATFFSAMRHPWALEAPLVNIDQAIRQRQPGLVGKWLRRLLSLVYVRYPKIAG